MLTRRVLLAGVAPGAALALVGCTAAQQAAVTTAYDNFLAQVQSIVAQGCNIGAGFIPAIPSIEAVVNILYPGLGTAVAGIGGAINAVAGALCKAMPANPPAALTRKLSRARLGVSAPVHIGTITVGGQSVAVAGYGVSR